MIVGFCLSTGSHLAARERQRSELRPVSFPAMPVPPIDASRDDAELARLKETLLAAARARSFVMLKPVMAERVRLALHDFKMRDEAARQMSEWEPEASEAFWRNLENALTHGFAVTDAESAVAPYAAAAGMKCAYAPGASCAAIMGTRVIVRAAPRSYAPVVAVVSHEVVGAPTTGVPEGPAEPAGGYRYQWVEVVTSSGKVGFVSEKFVYADLGLVFEFRKEKGQWRFAGMTSGD